MLTDALQTVLFVSALMWPVTLPLLLGLVGGLIWLIVYAVRNWEKRSVQIGAGVLAACVLLFACALGMERQPYSESAARRLYGRHQGAYDAVAAYLLEEGGSYWVTSREKWPEGIEAELNEVLTAYLRCGSPYVSSGSFDWGGVPAVQFHIWSGAEYDSGDGGPAYDLQYLAYCPNRSRLSGGNSYTENLIHLTGDWYLYRTVNM